MGRTWFPRSGGASSSTCAGQSERGVGPGTIPWTFALHLCLLSSLRLNVFLSYRTRDMLVNNLSLPGFKYAS